MKFRTKLIIALIATTLIPYLILIIYTYQSYKSELKEDGMQTMVQAETIIHAAKQEISSALTTVQTWVTNKEIAKFASESSSVTKKEHMLNWASGAYTKNKIAIHLKKLEELTGERFPEIFITDSRGYAIAATGSTSDFDQGPEDDPPDGELWWAEAKKNSVSLGGIGFDKSAGVYAVDVAASLKYNNQFVGVLKASYNIEALLDTIERSEIGEYGHVVLVEETGLVGVAPKKLKHIIFNEEMSVKDTKSFQSVQEGKDGYVLDHIPWVGDALVGYSATVSRTGKRFYAFVIIPAEQALLTIKEALVWGIAILIFVGIVIVLVAVFLSKRISKPVGELVEGHKQIADGNFTYRVKIKTTDEFGKLGDSFNHMTEGLQVKQQLLRYVSKGAWQAAKRKAETGVDEIKGEKKSLTLLFSDIKGFTQMAEQLSPEQVVEILNGYFETMTRIINKHNGTIDKFIGDAIMAIFEDDSDLGAMNAVKAAIEMQSSMPNVNLKVGTTLKTRIGIHTGEVVVGDIGSIEFRKDFTCIGDNVNLTQRLEVTCKPGKIHISEDTYDLIKDKIKAVKLEPMELKGISKAQNTYEIDINDL